MRGIIDSRLRIDMPELWPSLCTIKTVVTATSASNQKFDSGSRTNVTGMVNIPCRLAPFIETRMTDDEQRTNSVEAKIVRRTAKLNLYLPTIDTRRMVAVISDSDGTGAIEYKIRGVEHDSQHFSTRIRLEILTP